MYAVIQAVTIGLSLAMLGLGVFISFRIFDFPDITADGSITTGAAITASLIHAGVSPFIAMFAGMCGGCVAGALTGLIHTKFKVNRLLSGILVMTALYSLNVHIMNRQASIVLLYDSTLITSIERFSLFLGLKPESQLWGMFIKDWFLLLCILVAVAVIAGMVNRFFASHLGMAMRATGDNEKMIRALGVDVDRMIILGLAVSNGLIALSGSILAQILGVADIQLGIGMIVYGLASVIIGQTLVRSKRFAWMIVGTILGSVVLRVFVAITFQLGLPPEDMKIITAVFVFVSLILPRLAPRFSFKKPSNREVAV